MTEKYFDMVTPNGERIEGVHEDAVEDHKRLGYKVVGPHVAPEESGELAGTAPVSTETAKGKK